MPYTYLFYWLWVKKRGMFFQLSKNLVYNEYLLFYFKLFHVNIIFGIAEISLLVLYFIKQKFNLHSTLMITKMKKLFFHFFITFSLVHSPSWIRSFRYNNLRWLVGLKLIQIEQQKAQLPLIILAKYLKPILCRIIKGTWESLNLK